MVVNVGVCTAVRVAVPVEVLLRVFEAVTLDVDVNVGLAKAIV